MSNDLKTSLTLLDRLRAPIDDGAWDRFYDQYAKVILHAARKHGVDESTAEDVLQETVVHVNRVLPKFRYDPAKGKFRNWVLTVAHFKALEASRALRRTTSAPGMEEVVVTEILTEDGEKEWRQNLVREALTRIKTDPRVNPRTIAIFYANAIDGVPIEELSRQFNVKENAIYQMKSRLCQRLRAEIDAIAKESPAPSQQAGKGAVVKAKTPPRLTEDDMIHLLEGRREIPSRTLLRSAPRASEMRARLKYVANLLAEAGRTVDSSALVFRESVGSIRVVPLAQELVVGREPGAGLRIAGDGELSRIHFKIFQERNDWFVEDLKSRNGTYVNNYEVRIEQRRLRSGDIVVAGEHFFVFVHDPAATGETPSPPPGVS